MRNEKKKLLLVVKECLISYSRVSNFVTTQSSNTVDYQDILA